MPWGIAKTASEKEKIKAEFADILNGLNSTGAIDWATYSQLFDTSHDLFDKMYALGEEKIIQNKEARR
jgi:hypothetical protein